MLIPREVIPNILAVVEEITGRGINPVETTRWPSVRSGRYSPGLD